MGAKNESKPKKTGSRILLGSIVHIKVYPHCLLHATEISVSEKVDSLSKEILIFKKIFNEFFLKK